MRNINLKIDINKQNYIYEDAMQNDDITLQITLFENGTPYNLGTNTVTLNWLKADGTFVLINTTKEISIINNVVNIILPRDCTRAIGEVAFELSIKDTNGKQISTFPLSIEVIGSVLSGNKEPSKNLITSIEELENVIDNKINQANAKKTELDTSIENAQDDINTINSAGNRTYTIPSTAWVGTEPNLSYILEHNLGGENLIVGVIDNDTKLSSMPDYKSIDSMKIELYSTTRRNITVTINKSAYTGSDSEWVSQEVIDARKGEVSLGNRLDGINSQLVEKSKQYINVKLPPIPLMPAQGDYINTNSKGTDDTLAIQSCIDYAEINNKCVIIPRGNYRIDNTLNLKKNTVIISDRATLQYNGSSGTCINIIGESIHNSHKPYIRGLIVRNVAYNQTGVGLYLESAIFGIIEDCDFFGFEYGVKHSTDVTDKWAYLNVFTKCRFTDNNYGIKLDAQSNGVTLDKCFIFGNKKCGIWMDRGYSARVINGEIEANGNNETGGHGVYIQGGSANVISGNYMEGNGFTDTNSASIHIDGTTKGYTLENIGTIIANNLISPSGKHTAIKIVNARGITITGNTMYETTSPTYDIDISEMTNLDDTIIMGNVPSLNGNIKTKPNLGTSTIQHGKTTIPNMTSLIPILSNYTNKVTNGSFENDATGWTLDAVATISIEQAKLGTKSVKVVTTGTGGYAKQSGMPTITGHKYYVVGNAYVVSATTSQAIIQFIGQNIIFNVINVNQWQKKSAIITATGISASLFVGCSSGTNTVYFDGIMIVDLTALFGVGNEPTLAWCDTNLLFK